MQPHPATPHSLRRNAMFQSLATLAAGLVLALPASAQFGGSAMGGMSGMGGPGRGGRGERPPMGAGDGAGAARDAAPDPALELARVESELGRLQLALKLSDAQSGAWLAFAGRVRAQAADRARERAPGDSTGTQAPDGMAQLRQAVDSARNRWTALEDIEAAARTLYPGLTAQQKPVLDQGILVLLAPPTARPRGRVAAEAPRH